MDCFDVEKAAENSAAFLTVDRGCPEEAPSRQSLCN